jgi:hypothetical protein
VLPEELVLFGDHSIEQLRRHLRERGRLAVLALEDRPDYTPRVVVAAKRRRVYVRGMGLEGARFVELLRALYEPQIPARHERHTRNQHT